MIVEILQIKIRVSSQLNFEEDFEQLRREIFVFLSAHIPLVFWKWLHSIVSDFLVSVK